jgi:hypothetical protein
MSSVPALFLIRLLLRLSGPKSQPPVVDSQLNVVGPLQRWTVSLKDMTSNPQTAQNTPRKRTLGPSQLSVGPIGLGCMTMTWAYGTRDRAESIATIRRAVELGVTLFDTADVYGPFTNEELVGEALQPNRDQIILATKCGLIVPDPKDYHHDASKFSITPNGRPEHIRQAGEDSLRRCRQTYESSKESKTLRVDTRQHRRKSHWLGCWLRENKWYPFQVARSGATWNKM